MSVCVSFYVKMSDYHDARQRTVILFHDGGHPITQEIRIRRHRHDHWQLQWVNGPWFLLTGKQRMALSKNHLVLIPPGVPHGFEHAGQGETYVAIMFQRPTKNAPDEVRVFNHGGFTKSWIRCAWELIRGGSGGASHAVLAPLIDALLAREEAGGSSGQKPGLARRAQAYLESNPGHSLSVQGMAGACGMSRGYLTTALKKTTGRTAKQWIDEYRLEQAKGVLQFGDFSISQIAEQLGYPDVFTFSKFFKKHCQMTPSEFRKAVMA